ncbi:unnamed protein product [Bursaphelenchus xylophilus]|uniref:(pine wood nematode) hypothetical protein n=1 Tax=Bursaphelenchus xylophilus TaxID=6326 RepID=A0A1I7SER8_BURXY|nr:unnamed protein product [Bursaphelenchus xylophilus]CAG9118797.1 unnamed protein product [Bursaphelenchus xylophilus]
MGSSTRLALAAVLLTSLMAEALSLAGVVHGLGYRPPPPKVRRQAKSMGHCHFDAEKWYTEPEVTISNAVMFDRTSGLTCTECMERCELYQNTSSKWVCRSLTYDHKYEICDIYAINGQSKPYYLTEYHMRDYFAYLPALSPKDRARVGASHELEIIDEEERNHTATASKHVMIDVTEIDGLAKTEFPVDGKSTEVGLVEPTTVPSVHFGEKSSERNVATEADLTSEQLKLKEAKIEAGNENSEAKTEPAEWLHKEEEALKTVEAQTEATLAPESTSEGQKNEEAKSEGSLASETNAESQNAGESKTESETASELNSESQKPVESTTEAHIPTETASESNLGSQKATESATEATAASEASIESQKSLESRTESHSAAESISESHSASETISESHSETKAEAATEVKNTSDTVLLHSEASTEPSLEAAEAKTEASEASQTLETSESTSQVAVEPAKLKEEVNVTEVSSVNIPLTTESSVEAKHSSESIEEHTVTVIETSETPIKLTETEQSATASREGADFAAAARASKTYIKSKTGEQLPIPGLGGHEQKGEDPIPSRKSSSKRLEKMNLKSLRNIIANNARHEETREFYQEQRTSWNTKNIKQVDFEHVETVNSGHKNPMLSLKINKIAPQHVATDDIEKPRPIEGTVDASSSDAVIDVATPSSLHRTSVPSFTVTKRVSTSEQKAIEEVKSTFNVDEKKSSKELVAATEVAASSKTSEASRSVEQPEGFKTFSSSTFDEKIYSREPLAPETSGYDNLPKTPIDANTEAKATKKTPLDDAPQEKVSLDFDTSQERKKLNIGKLAHAVKCTENEVLRFVQFGGYEQSHRDHDAKLELLPAGSLEECQKACIESSAFECASATHSPTGCILSSKSANHAEANSLVVNKESTYLEKVCLPKTLADTTKLIFEAVPAYILVGHVQEVTDASSLRQCQIDCLQAQEKYGFRCRSAMWYPADSDQNCLLNSENKQTQPTVFVPEDEGVIMFYFDVPRTDDSPISQNRRFKDLPFKRRVSKWTHWSKCDENKEYAKKHRYVKCSNEKDIRKCPKQTLNCKNVIEPTQPHIDGECRAVRDPRGNKRCPHGVKLDSFGIRHYCTPPVDCY